VILAGVGINCLDDFDDNIFVCVITFYVISKNFFNFSKNQKSLRNLIQSYYDLILY